MPKASKTFRIFVSSTFSDFKEERNALQREVFPKLKELCTQHGCSFQAIDLRWGVSEEASLDQRTMSICLEELRRCQTITPRPNFILLLGDRYGWRPLPEQIPADEFEEIINNIIDNEEKELLNKWYKRDDNAIPPVYCLQPRTGEFVRLENWELEERKLRSILLKAISKIPLPPEKLIKYTASATEQEVINGIFNIPDASEHVFCFFRSIFVPQEDGTLLPIKNAKPLSRFKDFIDLDPCGNLDEDANKRLENLKINLEELLPGHIFKYKAEWKGDGITLDHLDKLCEDIRQALERVIMEEIARMEAVDTLVKEIQEHEDFRKEREKFFVGREETLKKIGEYIKGKEPQALVIYGVGGSGKSSLIAYAIGKAKEENPDAEIFFRFIGTTPSSSDGRALLESLCRQITRSYGGNEADIPFTYEDLLDDLPKRLSLATAEKPLIIFLDALDQLSDVYTAEIFILRLLDELPENVRLIVTTRPGQSEESTELLDIIRGRLKDEIVIELKPMSKEEGGMLLDIWLKNASRTLQPSQREEVLGKFARNGLPLYLKLAFEEARRWKSYTPPVKLNPDLRGLIEELYERLEKEHGKVLAQRSLSYMAITREMQGLSEDELIDVLSEDGEVFEEFKRRARHEPPEQRIPVVIWSRLYFDMEPYLAVRKSEGVTLLTFYHRELGEAVKAKYLPPDEERRLHNKLSEYFRKKADPEGDGSWKGTPRALSELPFHQTMAGKWEELFKTLTDFSFLENKASKVGVMEFRVGEEIKAIYGGVFSLSEDFNRALALLPEEEEKWG
jgi:predicted AAA+ superfamily ATPase